MFDFCNAHNFLSAPCETISQIENYFSWLDQRINLNEGVIALIAALLSIGMQNAKGARRAASIGLIVLAFLFGVAALFEGPTRTLRGEKPFIVVIPSVFHNVHGDKDSLLASDDAGRNSVQLLSGNLVHETPADYLNNRCPGDIDKFAARNEIDDPTTIVFTLKTRVSGNACVISWHEKGVALDHYEVYAVYSSDNGASWEYGRLHLRAEKPTHVLVREDYVNMRNTFLKSAGIAPPGD